MLTSYGTRPEHFDPAYPFTSRPKQRVGFKMGRWSTVLIDAAAVFTGLALMAPFLLVFFSPFIVSALN